MQSSTEYNEKVCPHDVCHLHSASLPNRLTSCLHFCFRHIISLTSIVLPFLPYLFLSIMPA